MKTTPPKRRYQGSLVLVLIVLAVYVLWALSRPLPVIPPSQASLQLRSGTLGSQLAWPSKGQAAVGINPSGVLATNGAQTPQPIASTAKVLAALCILKKKPLGSGKSGPTITINAQDVAIYNDYVAKDGSVTAINEGEELTEYQLLQAILLPSANNAADTLAIWAFGSLGNYAAFANNYTRQLGFTHTHVGTDASGYDPSTVSTAHDLVLLGEAAMQEPVIAQIVAQPSADIPVAGEINNVNFLLGKDGIIGVKTGNTEQAGGVFLAAQTATVNGKRLTLISAVVGGDTLYDAMSSSLPLLRSAQANFATATILKKGAIVGHYAQPWGGTIAVKTAAPLDVLVWKGATVPADIRLKPITTSAKRASVVGAITVPISPVSRAQKVDLVLDSGASGVPVVWRLLHPF